uniref:(northern house mosquito) hypothetical protein n=1 Tax=Culex pipiens TaxID=7175 RepID=A0A8D8DIR4_CULPI
MNLAASSTCGIFGWAGTVAWLGCFWREGGACDWCFWLDFASMDPFSIQKLSKNSRRIFRCESKRSRLSTSSILDWIASNSSVIRLRLSRWTGILLLSRLWL